ncbi:MAG: prepilin-type N-terminal cleavage/methylation domain-containing protein [Verrucomicrobia bacterium]|nr:prepilin-type N-terminal cleavage/methylation domain-containing protein [Verrucomicrobiota bacterium]
MHSTLANVGSPLRRPARRGFTMLEVLLALAIIALLASVLVGGSASLLAGSKAVTPAEVFWKTVQECRKSALKSGTDVRLVFDAKEKKFVASDASGRDSATREYSIPASGDDLTFTFLSLQKGASMMLIGGVAVETQTLPAVTFYSDGTCTPFRAQIYRRGEATVLSIDPWTCAAVLKPDDPNAPSL